MTDEKNGTLMTNAKILRISAAEYHADPAPEPSLSSSIANLLLTKTPAHAHLQHPRLGGATGKTSAALDNGSLLDALILGGWESKIGIVHSDAFRSNAAKEARDGFRAEGKTPVLAADFAEAFGVATKLKAKLADRGFAFTGESQVVILWQEETSFGPIWCRAMLDHVFLDDGVIWDLKTISAASPKQCANSSFDWGYHVQGAAYRRAVDRVMIKKRFGGPSFTLLFCETEPPFCVTPSQLNGMFSELGERRWLRACETWGRCLKEGNWPEYTNGTVRLEPPPWAMAREMEEAS